MELSLTKLPWWGQVAAFVVLGLAGIGGYFYYYDMDKQADIALRAKNLEDLRTEINRGLKTAAKLNDFKQQVGDLEARLSNLKAILPEEKDAQFLLRQMQTVAAQSSITIKSFKPNPTVAKTLHSEWPISLELEGTYHNLATFYDRVSRFTRIVNISQVDIKAKTPPQPNATIVASCTATTFVLTDKNTAAAKPGAKGAAAPAPAAKGN